MRMLTDYQKEFLVEYFIKNEKYPGWKTIATNLLEYGTCIVAGNECIWIGGIGNFIKLDYYRLPLEECVEYIFDLEYFLTSEWYKHINYQYITMLSDKKRSIEQKYKEICNL